MRDERGMRGRERKRVRAREGSEKKRVRRDREE